MKRLKALFVAIILSLVISSTFLHFYTKKEKKEFDELSVQNNSIRYNDSPNKYKSHDAITKNIGKGTIILLGSSELIVTNDWKEHPKQFLDSLLPYMLRQHLISEIRQNHQTYYMIRK